METIKEMLSTRAIVSEKYYKVKGELTALTKMCIKALLEANGGRIEVTTEMLDDYGHNPTVSYDGGNHPEYASNAFSSVYGALLDKDGDINVICEDCDKYNIDRVWNLDEIEDIADLLEWYNENKDNLKTE